MNERRHLRVVGIIERRQPLPFGRYWVSVFSDAANPDRMTHFQQWCDANKQTILVEHREPVGQGTRNGQFTIFSVLIPTRFDVAQFGNPNVAGPEIQTADDTVQRPPKPKPSDILDDFFKALQGSGITTIAFIAVAALVLAKGKDR